MDSSVMLAALLLAQANTSVATQSSAWKVETTQSELDDSRGAVAFSYARQPYQNRYGKAGTAELQIVCESNKTGIGLVLPELYTSDNSRLGEVTFRVDKGKAFTRAFTASNDKSSLAIFGGEAIRSIKQMLGGQSLLVQFITVNEPSQTVTFSLAGFENAIGPVRRACNW